MDDRRLLDTRAGRPRRTRSRRSRRSSATGSRQVARIDRPGGDALRLGARVAEGHPAYQAARARWARLRRARLGGRHRRRARRDGGREPRRPGGRRALGRLQHRAPARAGVEPVPRHLLHLRALLRAQGLLREAGRGLRHLPRRLRHARRALRGADADPDGQGAALPGRPLRLATTGRSCSTGCATCSTRG